MSLFSWLNGEENPDIDQETILGNNPDDEPDIPPIEGGYTLFRGW
jgi:hypothetical protein